MRAQGTMKALANAAAALLLALPPAAKAGCSLSSSGMAFGTYQPLTLAGKLVSTDRTSNATVSLVCTGVASAASYTVSLGPSTGGSYSPRYLSNPVGEPPMAFNIYLDPSHTVVWGDGTAGTRLSGSIPAGDSHRTHTVYGKVPAGQKALRPGSFSGTLSMTLTYNP
jgi:spore coat protein U-like protein